MLILQRSSVLGNKIEMEITQLVEQNPTLVRLGLHLEYSDARHRIASHLQKNIDRSEYPTYIPAITLLPQRCGTPQYRRSETGSSAFYEKFIQYFRVFLRVLFQSILFFSKITYVTGMRERAVHRGFKIVYALRIEVGKWFTRTF